MGRYGPKPYSVRRVPACDKKEVSNLKGSITDGFGGIGDWVWSNVAFGAGTILRWLGTVRSPVDSGFPSCSAQISASTPSV